MLWKQLQTLRELQLAQLLFSHTKSSIMIDYRSIVLLDYRSCDLWPIPSPTGHQETRSAVKNRVEFADSSPYGVTGPQ